ncbi:MAG: hypothetical protein ACKO21_04130, partial [Nodosilinea sp.]
QHSLSPCQVFNRTALPAKQFERCVRRAENLIELGFWVASEIFIPYEFQFYNRQSLSDFSILTNEQNRAELLLKISAFDEADANHQFVLHARPILDVISAFTNLFFEIEQMRQTYYNFLPEFPQSMKPTFPINWLDNYPVVERNLILPDYCLEFINDIIRGNIDKKNRLIIDACHHFHSARVMEEKSHNFQSEPASELAVVLYVSSLEVLSLFSASVLQTCPTCSQPQYRIASRVTEFMEHYNGPHAAKIIKDLGVALLRRHKLRIRQQSSIEEG